MINLHQLSLRKKIILFIVFSILTTGFILFFSQYQFFNQNILQKSIRDHQKLISILSSKINTSYQIEKEPKIYPILQSFSIYDEILDISVFKNDFEVAFYNKTEPKFHFNPSQKESRLSFDDYIILKETMNVKDQKIDVMVRISIEDLKALKQRFFNLVLVIVIILVLISLPMIYFLNTSISKPINELSAIANQITEKKDYSIKIERKGSDEISKLYQSIGTMLQEINYQQKTIQSINEDLEKKIEERIQEIEIEAQKSNQLAEELKNKQRIDEGILKFTEIISSNAYDNIERWGDNLLYHLVKFIHADMAALYITDDIDKSVKLKLISSYAYDIKTMLKRAFEAGDGITGQAVKNKESVYLTDLPDGFLKLEPF